MFIALEGGNIDGEKDRMSQAPLGVSAEQWVATSLRGNLRDVPKTYGGNGKKERGNTIEGTQTRDSTCPYKVKLALLKYIRKRTNDYKVSSHNQTLFYCFKPKYHAFASRQHMAEHEATHVATPLLTHHKP